MTIGSKILLSLNLFVYGGYLLSYAYSSLFPRIEILSGQPYVWPLQYRVSFAAQALLAALVVLGCIYYMVSKRRAGPQMVAFAVAIHAGMAIDAVITSYPLMLENGYTFRDAPAEIVLPSLIFALAIANWRWCFRACV